MASNANLEFILTVAAQQGLSSLDLVEKEIKKVTLAFKEATTQAERLGYATRLQELGGFKTAMMGATTAIHGTQQASSNAAMALLNLNYVIRDSPYFFNNFALGLLAVGNNLNPLIDSFGRLRKEALEKNLTTMEMLKKAMVGGAGISIAFSVVVTAIQAFVFSMSRAKRETKEMAEATGELKVEMEDVIKAVNQMRDSFRQEQIKDLATRQASDLERLEELQIRRRKLWFESMRLLRGDPRKAAIATEMEDITREINFIVDLWSKTLEKQKDSTKELKKQKEFIAGQRPLLMELVELMREYNALLAAQEMGGGRAGTSGGGLRPSGGTQPLKNPMIDTLKQIEKDLKEEFAPTLRMITDAANIAGNAISNAFLTGKNVIDAATQALLQFITQLLVVQTLMGIFTALFIPGGSFLSGFMGGMFQKTAVPAGGSLSKGTTIRVEGNLRAEGNEFIAGFNKSVNIYNRNVKGASLGR